MFVGGRRGGDWGSCPFAYWRQCLVLHSMRGDITDYYCTAPIRYLLAPRNGRLTHLWSRQTLSTATPLTLPLQPQAHHTVGTRLHVCILFVALDVTNNHCTRHPIRRPFSVLLSFLFFSSCDLPSHRRMTHLSQVARVLWVRDSCGEPAAQPPAAAAL